MTVALSNLRLISHLSESNTTAHMYRESQVPFWRQRSEFPELTVSLDALCDMKWDRFEELLVDLWAERDTKRTDGV